MIRLELELLTNNIVIPFQSLHKHLDFVRFNKLFATQSLAEHGLGFLIKIFEIENPSSMEEKILVKKLVFDTGGQNSTFMHNMSVRGYQTNDIDGIILSHWHYDHNGGLYEILGGTDQTVPIYTHKAAKYERFFSRAPDISPSDLRQKHRNEIVPLLKQRKIVNQKPINLDKISNLNGRVEFSKKKTNLLSKGTFNIICSGEIPRKHSDEGFSNYFTIKKDDLLEVDNILDDRCLFFEFNDRIVLLNGCCHSGLKNTIDHVQNISNKPISHIIGGFHMASASDERISSTIEYLKGLELYNDKLYLFPIHCTGKKFLQELNERTNATIQAFDASVGTKFIFEGP